MPDRGSETTGWLRRVLGGEGRATARYPGVDTMATGRRALHDTELRLSEAVCLTDEDVVALGEGEAVNVFGGRVLRRAAADPGGILATAAGLALTGRRTTAFLKAPGARELGRALGRAVDRRAPFLLQLTLADHDTYHALAGTGALLALARDGAEALDLALVLRRIAELTLTPAVLALEEVETALTLRRLTLAEDELLREFVGDPADEIESPDRSQALVLGARRRRLPRWFDTDRPVATGVPLAGADRDAAALGRRVFFEQELLPAASAAMEAFAALTARPLSLVSRYGAERARQVIVTQGAAVDVAESAADYLRRTGGGKTRVVGLTWLRPFPAPEIAAALSGAETITVLERTDAAGEPPLLREVASALGDRASALVSATYSRLHAGELVALIRNMAAGEAMRREVRLGTEPPTLSSGFPKRQRFLQRLRRDYPALDRMTLPADRGVDLRAESTRTVAIHVRGPALPEATMRSLDRTMREAVGDHVRVHCREVGVGSWRVRATAAAEPFLDPGANVPAELVLVWAAQAFGDDRALDELAPRGSVVAATELAGSDLWDAMPATWRARIREREARLFVLRDDPERLVDAVEPFLAGNHDAFEVVPWEKLRPEPEVEAVPELPMVVRRLGESGTTYDNVARFWGELAQPRSQGEAPGVPDPYVTLGVVPSCTATFEDRTVLRERVPWVDPARCTGCGRCWVSCPDSALAPVALGTAELLDAAADAAAERSGREADEAAGQLRRAHSRLAARIDSLLAKAGPGALCRDLLNDAFDWLLDKMRPGDDKLPGLRAAFEETSSALASLPLAVTEPLFFEAHRASKGSGRLLMLAVAPRACQSCGICDAVCTDDAIRLEPQTSETVERMRGLWRAWEQLPDTTGETIGRVADDRRIGSLPAILLSRHCLFSLTGGDGAERGSGARMAARQTLAVTEYQTQRRLVALVARLDGLENRLREAVHNEVASKLAVEDLEHLDRALAEGRRAGGVGEIASRLEALGERTDVDAAGLRRLVRAAREVEHVRRLIAEGNHGAGRARFGLVVSGRSTAEWAARFGRNPFSVPLAVDLEGNDPDLAIGIACGLLEQRVEEAKAIRRAELLLEAPSDLPARARAVEALTAGDLAAEELELLPPLLVMGGPDGFGGPELPGLFRLLSSGLPLQVILFDEGDLRSTAGDPVLRALARREAFVLSGSPSHPDHLFEGLGAALQFRGPSLIRLCAPSPRRHGFPRERTVERARLAVTSRVHPLLRYDPSEEGVFGQRIRLDGNPDPERTWAVEAEGHDLTPAHWAFGESRFDDCFSAADDDVPSVPIEEWLNLPPDQRGAKRPTVPGPNGGRFAVGRSFCTAISDRAARWRTLQELAGVVTPFTDRVRREVEAELDETHRGEAETLRREYETRLAQQEQAQTAAQIARLRDRLLQLAGYGAARKKPEGEAR